MRIAYLDCFAGISGDMFLAALIDAGVNPDVLHNAAAAMNLGVTLRISTVDRSGISSVKVDVLADGQLADAKGLPANAQTPTHSHEHTTAVEAKSEDTFLEQRSIEQAPLQHQPKTQHLHKTGHPHTHTHSHVESVDQAHTHDDHGSTEHAHVHGRSLSIIRALIQASTLDTPIKATAIRTFERLGASEAKIHNVPMDDIHFHEVGAVDAIVDIVAASAGIHALAADRWVCSQINVGGGMVDCAHGRFPVPAPATADLLRGLPTYSANIQMELVTPTGAALLRTLVEENGLSFGPQPAMRVGRIGYGAGSRNPNNFPNVLRLSIGESVPSLDEAASSLQHEYEIVTVLETALDDLSPQVIAHVAEAALQQNALDVMLTPVLMKKGRPGTLITILCTPADSRRFEELLLRETSTLGVRIRQDRRSRLERSHTTVETAYGPIPIKLGIRSGETLNAHPEFEDCRIAASIHHVPLKQVQQAALAAWLQDRPGPGDREAGRVAHD